MGLYFDGKKIVNSLIVDGDLSSPILEMPTIKAISNQAVATFDTDMAERLVNLQVAVTATGGGGTPSTPISINGFSACDVTNERTSEMLSGETIGSNGLIFTASQYDVKYLPCVLGKQYTLYTNEPNMVYAFFDTLPAHGVTSYNGSRTVTSNTTETITAPINGWLAFRQDNTIIGKSYCGNTYNISFGQTIYGGSLDVISGKLTITHGYVDLGSLTWTNYLGGSLKMIYMQFPDCPTPPNNTTRASLICSNMPTKSRSEIGFAEPYNDGIGIDVSGNLFVAYPSGTWTDLTSAKNGLSGWYICYELATPTTIQLTSEEVQAIIGTNNIYTDTGDIIDLKYILSVGQAIS